MHFLTFTSSERNVPKLTPMYIYRGGTPGPGVTALSPGGPAVHESPVTGLPCAFAPADCSELVASQRAESHA